MKIAVVYWSGSGNTEAMADAVVEAVQENGAEAEKIYVSDFTPDVVGNYDAYAFGCPAMGSEVLEEGEFEPAFSMVESMLTGKKVGLFGSYGWGDGEWMRNWQERCVDDGMEVVSDGVICMNDPQEDTIEQLKELAKNLVA